MLKRRETVNAIKDANLIEVKRWEQQRIDHLKRVNLCFDWLEKSIAGESKFGKTLVKVDGVVMQIDNYNFDFDNVILNIKSNDGIKSLTKNF